MLRTGEVRINKKRAKASDKLMLDDQVRLPPLYQATTTEVRIPTHWQKEFANAILYDDEDLLILNKPPGIPVHGGSNADFGVIRKGQIIEQKLALIACQIALKCKIFEKENAVCAVINRQITTEHGNVLCPGPRIQGIGAEIDQTFVGEVNLRSIGAQLIDFANRPRMKAVLHPCYVQGKNASAARRLCLVGLAI